MQQPGEKAGLRLEPVSKRFSLVKVKADENFNRRNTWSISRIKIFTQRRDWPKWDVLKLAPVFDYSIDSFYSEEASFCYLLQLVFRVFFCMGFSKYYFLPYLSLLRLQPGIRNPEQKRFPLRYASRTSSGWPDIFCIILIPKAASNLQKGCDTAPHIKVSTPIPLIRTHLRDSSCSSRYISNLDDSVLPSTSTINSLDAVSNTGDTLLYQTGMAIFMRNTPAYSSHNLKN